MGSRSGALDPRPEIAGRVRRALEAGRSSREPPEGASGTRGSIYVRDLVDRDLVFVCRPEGRDKLVVVTLWEAGRVGEPRVPRAFTDALEGRGRGGSGGVN